MNHLHLSIIWKIVHQLHSSWLVDPSHTSFSFLLNNIRAGLDWTIEPNQSSSANGPMRKYRAESLLLIVKLFLLGICICFALVCRTSIKIQSKKCIKIWNVILKCLYCEEEKWSSNHKTNEKSNRVNSCLRKKHPFVRWSLHFRISCHTDLV